MGQNERRYIECTRVNLHRLRFQVQCVDVVALRVISVPCNQGVRRANVYLRACDVHLHPQHNSCLVVGSRRDAMLSYKRLLGVWLRWVVASDCSRPRIEVELSIRQILHSR